MKLFMVHFINTLTGNKGQMLQSGEDREDARSNFIHRNSNPYLRITRVVKVKQ